MKIKKQNKWDCFNCLLTVTWTRCFKFADGKSFLKKQLRSFPGSLNYYLTVFAPESVKTETSVSMVALIFVSAKVQEHKPWYSTVPADFQFLARSGPREDTRICSKASLSSGLRGVPLTCVFVLPICGVFFKHLWLLQSPPHHPLWAIILMTNSPKLFSYLIGNKIHHICSFQAYILTGISSEM